MKMSAKKKQKSKKGDKKASTSILDKAEDIQDSEGYISAVFYGRSGTGKTTVASTFPKPLLLLDFGDKGHDSIKDVEGVKRLLIQEWMDIESVYWGLASGNHDFKSVIWDTVTGSQDTAIYKVKDDEGMDPTDPVSRRMWGEVSGLMKEWLINFRDLEMHTAFLAQERITKEEESEETEQDDDQIDPEVGPATIPSVQKTLCASVKVVGHTYIKQVIKRLKGGKTKRVPKFMMRVGPHPYYTTKIRSPKDYEVPGSIDNPDFDKIQKIMKGEKL